MKDAGLELSVWQKETEDGLVSRLDSKKIKATPTHVSMQRPDQKLHVASIVELASTEQNRLKVSIEKEHCYLSGRVSGREFHSPGYANISDAWRDMEPIIDAFIAVEKAHCIIDSYAGKK